MAEEKKESKTLEMRVAELEDKLAKMHVTEEEMKAYEKVSSLMGSGAAATATSTSPCVATSCTIRPCTVRPCVIRPCVIRPCIIHPCWECIHECGGGCLPGGGSMGGGGFGSFGA